MSSIADTRNEVINNSYIPKSVEKHIHIKDGKIYLNKNKKMTLKEYQEKCLEVAIYPNIGNNYIYTFLGLVGEWGEFYEKAELIDYYGKTSNEVKKELGDLYWYLVMCCYELKIDLETVQQCIDTNCREETNNLKTIIRFISQIAETFKKVIRDDNELGNVEGLFYGIFVALNNYISYRGWDFNEIIQMNVDKLKGRKERGVLNGSGDNR